jgi:sec-independent protein translocase protein TatC
MTFGEHLEELRACLFKSVLGLVAGFIFGLIFGGPVVSFIQYPLQSALADYYRKQSTEHAEKMLAELEKAGAPAPFTAKQIRDLIYEDRLLVEARFIEPGGVLRQLKQEFPDKFGEITVPAADPEKPIRRSDLLPLFVFHSVENDPRVQVKSLNAQEAFTIYMKAALLVGVVVASPWIFYQIWSFVGAGLYSHERHYVKLYLPFSLILFFSGAVMAFAFVFQQVLRFLFSFNAWMGISPEPRINEWLGFVLILPLGFGIAFQLPLVMFFLERIGIFSVQAYVRKWRIAILAIFLVSALLTPPDPYSLCLMAFPLVFLYFGGILLCKVFPRKRRAVEELDG